MFFPPFNFLYNPDSVIIHNNYIYIYNDPIIQCFEINLDQSKILAATGSLQNCRFFSFSGLLCDETTHMFRHIIGFSNHIQDCNGFE